MVKGYVPKVGKTGDATGADMDRVNSVGDRATSMADISKANCSIGLHQWGDWTETGNLQRRQCRVCAHAEQRIQPVVRRNDYDPYSDM